MPTLQCANCGANYYSAATDHRLELVLIMFGCEVCGEDRPLHVIDGGVGYIASNPERHAA